MKEAKGLEAIMLEAMEPGRGYTSFDLATKLNGVNVDRVREAFGYLQEYGHVHFREQKWWKGPRVRGERANSIIIDEVSSIGEPPTLPAGDQ